MTKKCNAKHLFALLFACFVITLPLSGKISCLFSPDDKPTKKLLEYIGNARRSIYIAMYMLTDKSVAEALIAAKKNRNVTIQVIVDPITAESTYGKANLLTTNGIPVFVFNPETKNLKTSISNTKWFSSAAIMHNKFALFDESLVWTGSFNWTVAANTHNCENVIITDDQEICKRYRRYFDALIKRCRHHVATADQNKKKSSLHHSIAQLLDVAPDDATLLEQLTNLIGTYAVGMQEN